MDRSPLQLAALASAAVPGLDPVAVEALPTIPGDRFETAIVRDTEHRHWVVRSPRSETAAAALDAAVPLLGLLARRLSVAVPAPKGFVALKEGGRAAVHPLLPGHALEFAALPSGPGLATEVGRALAAVHNLDPALYDEAGVPAYDADTYRTRRLSDLDRAAASGRVPTGLLTRWEHALEDVSLWRFATTPIHGSLSGDHILAVFDGDDADSGRVRGLLGWESAQIADPAEDFADLVHEASAEAVASVLEAYAHSRVERPDPHLLIRARLLGELSVLRELMEALARADTAAADGLTSRLRRLDDHVHSLEESSDDYRRMSLSAAGARVRPVAPSAPVEDEDDEELPSAQRGDPTQPVPVLRREVSEELGTETSDVNGSDEQDSEVSDESDEPDSDASDQSDERAPDVSDEPDEDFDPHATQPVPLNEAGGTDPVRTERTRK